MRYLIGLAGDETFELPVEAAEADVGILLAERDAELGRAPFTSATVLERQRELRVTTHLLDLAKSFMGQDAHPNAHSNCRVCLVIASEREDFFMDTMGLTREESSVATAKLYGDIIEELEVPGAHLAVCARCITGDVDEFNALLCRLVCSDSH